MPGRTASLRWAALPVVTLVVLCAQAHAASTSLVISQVYAGAGAGGGATYMRDYVEVFNRGPNPVPTNGWSVQYANSPSSTWSVTALPSMMLQPGQYLLVAEATGASGLALPTPDASGSISMANSSGKVALCNSTSSLSGSCPTGGSIVDFVGYGSTVACSETAPTGTPSQTSAVFRNAGGCTDADDNSADFTVASPNPRNTASAFAPCSYPLSGSGSASPGTVSAGGAALLTVSVTPALGPPSTGITVSGNLTSIGGSGTQAFYDDGTHGDVVGSDNVFSFQATVSAGTGAGAKSLPISIQDAQTRSASTSIPLTVTVLSVTIDQIQGPGATSPYVGQVLSTQGIVTHLTSDGFFLETSDAGWDADANTSEGIFVSDPGHAASVFPGYALSVNGTVTETPVYADPAAPRRTQITYASHALQSTGNLLPSAVGTLASDFDPAGPSFGLERLESMRVSMSSLTVFQPTGGTYAPAGNTVSSNDRCFAVYGSSSRPRREAGYDRRWTLPGGAPCCVPAWDADPESFAVEGLGNLSAGTVVPNVSGVLDFADRRYAVLVDASGAASGGLGSVAVSDVASDEFTIGSLVLDRFYDSVDDPGSDIVVTPAAFSARLAKLVPEIRDLMKYPDVLCVQSVENLSTLQSIATALNGGGVDYAPYLVEGNDPAGLDVGLLVRASRMNVGSVTQLDAGATYVEPTNGQTVNVFDQPPLLLTGSAVNGAGPNTPIAVMALQMLPVTNADTSAATRNRRRQQAEHVANLLQARQVANTNENLVAIGIESYEFSDGAVDVFGTIRGAPAPSNQVLASSADLVTPDFVDAGAGIASSNRYDTTQDGVTAALTQCVFADNVASLFRRTEYARCNADAPESARTQAGVATRAGPRDGMVVVLHHGGTAGVEDSAPTALAIESIGRERSGAGLAVTFTLPSKTPAALEAFDVSGRRVARAELGGLGPGRHTATLAMPTTSQVVLVRLRQEGRTVVEKRALLQ